MIIIAEAQPTPLPATGREIGVDVGVARFLTTSDGHIVANPRVLGCHTCGNRCTRPRQDTVICPHCGPLDADLNGARNIATRAGLGSGQTAPAA